MLFFVFKNMFSFYYMKKIEQVLEKLKEIKNQKYIKTHRKGNTELEKH